MNTTHTIRTTIALAAIAFFATPIALALLGVEARQFENRKLAHAPKPSQGWDAFGQATEYLIDRMPLRKQAVEANTRIWTDLFGTDPRYGDGEALARDPALPFSGAVERGGDDAAAAAREGILGAASARRGRNGWLYLAEETEQACEQATSDLTALGHWAKLVRRLRAYGHDATMFVVPLKASVYPENLLQDSADRCALKAKRAFWRHLTRHGPRQGVQELRSELLRRKARHGDKLWQAQDSHWTTLGALSLVEAAVAAVGGGVQMRPDEVSKRGLVTHSSDLGGLDGGEDGETYMEYDVRRAAGAPRVPGRTLLLCDSFAYKWERLFKPYFERLTVVPIYNTPEAIVDAIRKSDAVIVEANELVFTTSATSDADASAAAGNAQGIAAELVRREAGGGG